MEIKRFNKTTIKLTDEEIKTFETAYTIAKAFWMAMPEETEIKSEGGGLMLTERDMKAMCGYMLFFSRITKTAQILEEHLEEVKAI